MTRSCGRSSPRRSLAAADVVFSALPERDERRDRARAARGRRARDRPGRGLPAAGRGVSRVVRVRPSREGVAREGGLRAPRAVRGPDAGRAADREPRLLPDARDPGARAAAGGRARGARLDPRRREDRPLGRGEVGERRDDLQRDRGEHPPLPRAGAPAHPRDGARVRARHRPHARRCCSCRTSSRRCAGCSRPATRTLARGRHHGVAHGGARGRVRRRAVRPGAPARRDGRFEAHARDQRRRAAGGRRPSDGDGRRRGRPRQPREGRGRPGDPELQPRAAASTRRRPCRRWRCTRERHVPGGVPGGGRHGRVQAERAARPGAAGRGSGHDGGGRLHHEPRQRGARAALAGPAGVGLAAGGAREQRPGERGDRARAGDADALASTAAAAAALGVACGRGPAVLHGRDRRAAASAPTRRRPAGPRGRALARGWRGLRPRDHDDRHRGQARDRGGRTGSVSAAARRASG